MRTPFVGSASCWTVSSWRTPDAKGRRFAGPTPPASRRPRATRFRAMRRRARTASLGKVADTSTRAAASGRRPSSPMSVRRDQTAVATSGFARSRTSVLRPLSGLPRTSLAAGLRCLCLPVRRRAPWGPNQRSDTGKQFVASSPLRTLRLRRRHGVRQVHRHERDVQVPESLHRWPCGVFCAWAWKT